MPKIAPATLSLLVSEEFLSIANPFLLQLEIAAAMLLGIGIVYESDKYPASVHKSAFWFVVIGVVLETVFSILLFASEERIASIQRGDLKSATLELEATTKTATAATERAAKLEKEAAELQTKNATLEREVGLRHLNGPLFLSILGNGPKGEFEIIYGAEDRDSMLLALSLRVLLQDAGWRLIDEKAVPLNVLLKQATVLPMNVQIEVHSFGEREVPILLPQPEATKLGLPRTLYSVVAGAIMAGLGGVQHMEGGNDPSLPDDGVRITVFPR